MKNFELFKTALQYKAAGLDVIPDHPVEKYPYGITGWQTKNFLSAELQNYIGEKGWSIGIRDQEGLDFDNVGNPEALELLENWKSLVEEFCPGLTKKLLIEKTKRGGFHVVWKCKEIEENQKVANRPPTPEELKAEPKQISVSLIETRGKGGQFVVAPSPGYTLLQGNWRSLTEITPEERETLIRCAKTFDKMPVVPVNGKPIKAREGEERPGDIYDQRNPDEALDILKEAGWTEVYRKGDTILLRRPGKSRGISATFGHVAPGVLYNFSANGAPFEPNRAYSPFGVFALLKHQGDFSKAAGEVAKKYHLINWGQDLAPMGLVALSPVNRHENGKLKNELSPVNVPSKDDLEKALIPVFLPSLSSVPEDLKWIWEGYLARGRATLISALWKSGKSTLIAHLFKAIQNSQPLAGQATKKCRTLILSEESEADWVARRDKLGLIGNTWIIARPIKAKLNYQEWLRLIKHAAKICEEKQIDLFIVDTLSGFWSVQDENDAAKVQANLLPLNYLLEKNIAVLLIHHFRKSGGDEGTASRGSGVLGSWVDVLVEFTRLNQEGEETSQRVLKAYSRYEITPKEVVIDLIDGEYQTLGDKSKVRQETKTRQLLSIISETEEMSSKDFYENWDREVMGARPSQRSIRRYLKNLTYEGKVAVHEVLVGKRKTSFYLKLSGDTIWGQAKNQNGENEANNQGADKGTIGGVGENNEQMIDFETEGGEEL